MTLIKWNNGKHNSNLPSLFSPYSLREAFGFPIESVQLLQNLLSEDHGLSNTNIDKSLPAVNITETADAMTIEVAAPGMNKKDFGIEFHDDQLKISYRKEKNSDEKKEENVLRREFGFESFERTFSFPETIDGEKIEATYVDGILKIVAPKKEEAKAKPAKSIDVK